jgi:hypothetical protein
VPDFEGTRDLEGSDITRAAAHLPGLDIEVTHRRSADAEQIAISLTAVPSFEEFGRMLEGANPFALWAQFAQLAWQPWLSTARALSVPWLSLLPGPGRGGLRSERQEPGHD